MCYIAGRFQEVMVRAAKVKKGECYREGEDWDVIYDPRQLATPKHPSYGNVLNSDQLLLLGPGVAHGVVTLRNSLSASAVVAPRDFRCFPGMLCGCKDCEVGVNIPEEVCKAAAAGFQEYLDREFTGLSAAVRF